MKLSQIMPQVTPMELKHPLTGVGLGIIFNLVGHDSRAFREKARELMKQKQGKKEEDFLKLEQDNQDLVAACIQGWNDEADEAFGPYSVQRANEVVKMDELVYVREQIELFVSQRANFFRTGTEES
jgi:hypothetical protein